MRKALLFLLSWAVVAFVAQPVQAQSADAVAVMDTLDEGAFLGWVLAHHPLARRAATLDDQAAAYLRKARGAFDPKLSAGTYRKLFEDKTYYDLPTAGISAPTRLGITPFAEFVNPAGTQINPERSVPESGQIAAGIRIPLGKNLITDAARTELAKAQAYVEANAAERTLQLNALVLDAAEAYWKWWKAAATADLASEALELAAWRADQIRTAHRLGDRAAIDTLEAGLQAQRREAERLEALADLAYARANALRFLWNEDGLPAAPSAELRPLGPDAAALVNTSATLMMASANWRVESHPVYQAGVAKLDMAAAEIRFRRDQLKPQLDLSLATLSGTAGPSDWDLSPDGLAATNLIGIKAAVPLLLRKERGNLELARIAQDQQQLTLDDKAAKLRAVVQGVAGGLPDLQASAVLAERVAAGSRALLDAEMVRLNIGESSLFQVNYRENQWLKARKDVIDRNVRWALGTRELGFALGQMTGE
jgi:outer membrane protein TolC